MNTTVDFKDFLNDPQVQQLISELEKLLPDILKALSAFLLIGGIIVAVLVLIGYILRSVALARIGHRRGIPLWGFAWIPGLRLITMGAIADDHDKKTVGRRHGFRVLLPVLLLICLVASFISTRMLSAQIAGIVAAFTSGAENGFRQLGTLSGGSLRSVLNVIVAVTGSLLGVFRCIAVYKILESCKRKYTFLNMILYLVVPFAAPIVLLAVSGSDSDKKKKKKKVLPAPEEDESDDTEAAKPADPEEV